MLELLDVMEKNPNLEISIEGHICCRAGWELDGMDEDLGTNNLSEMRAKTVYDYLIKNGIAAIRLSYKGFGPLYPLYAYPEKTEEEKTANRRVEIKIIKK
jgi:outer membrane protein OmpA-like peptidoglycan-associated protein